jgi:hypothetical protein
VGAHHDQISRENGGSLQDLTGGPAHAHDDVRAEFGGAGRAGTGMNSGGYT